MRPCGWLVLLAGCFGGGGGYGDDDPNPGTRPDANTIDACIPYECASQGASCGSIDDGCGGTLECGECAGLATCGGQGVANVCAIPMEERACDDGWCFEAPAPFAFTPTAMFALSATDAWAVGDRGVVMHFDGTQWRSISSGTVADLHDVWMASATDGWLVGSGGVIRRWNGATWTAVASGTTAQLSGVWGTSATNVYVVGNAVSKRWNGTSFSNASVTTPNLEDVFATGSKVFAVGEGYVWELVTAAWTKRTSDSGTFNSYRLSEIGGTANNIYALGRSFSFATGEDLAFHYDGTSWTRFSDPGDPEWTDVYADGASVFGASDQSIASLPSLERVQGPGGDMFAVAGAGGTTFVATRPQLAGELFTGTGASWTPATSFGKRNGLTRAAVIDDSVWFAGPDIVVEWRGGVVVHEIPTSHTLVGIAGTARDDVFVATDWEVFHFNGTSWKRIDGPAFTYPETIVVVGDMPVLVGEKVQRRVNDAWVPDDLGTTNVTYTGAAVHEGELFIAGTSRGMPYTPHVHRTTNGTWSELPAPPMQNACGIAVAGPDDIWVAGYTTTGTGIDAVIDGIVAHYDGTTWTSETRATAGKLCAITLHAGEVWVTGPGTALHRRAGNGAWTTTFPARAGAIRTLASQGSTLWAGGDYGSILRR